MKTKCVMHVCASRGTYSPNVDVNVTHFKSGLHDMQLTDAHLKRYLFTWYVTKIV